jgi:hypothetical protein
VNKTPPQGFVIVESGEDGFCADHRAGRLRIVASWGGGWEHVSVSHRIRCPLYEEMAHIARHFWPNEAAMQLHVPEREHINCHPFCLHWWRPIGQDIPRPPGWMVGTKAGEIIVL